MDKKRPLSMPLMVMEASIVPRVGEEVSIKNIGMYKVAAVEYTLEMRERMIIKVILTEKKLK